MRRVRAGVLGAVAVAATTGAVAFGVSDGEGSQATADSHELGTTAVPVERRTLVDSETVSGTLGYDDARTVTATGPGGVLTRLPSAGSTLWRGDVAYRVDEQPLLLLTGTLPLYRDLSWGVDDGADVKQLERNLDELGHDPGSVDETFTESTADAVRELQEAAGLDQTGAVTGAQFLVLPGALRVGAPQAAVGEQVGAGAPLYAATSTTRVVKVDLDAADEALAVVDAEATVTLPDGSRADATVVDVGTAATSTGTGDGEKAEADEPSADEPSAEATIPVTLRLKDAGAAGDLSVAPVTVTLTREQKKDVLSVPVTALVALVEGGYAVRVDEPGGSRLVGVEPGLYAGGYVEIVTGVADGDSVLVPE